MHVSKNKIIQTSGSLTKSAYAGTPFFKPQLKINSFSDRQAAIIPGDKTQSSMAGSFYPGSKLANTNLFIQRKPVTNCPVNAASLQNSLNPVPPIDTSYLPKGEITRDQFDFFVMQRYCAKEVKNGTQSDQETEIAPRGTSRIPVANWKDWNPGTSSEDYTHIIEAIEDVSNSMGGVPFLSRVVFYDKDYAVQNGVAVPRVGTGASFGAGVLTIYRSFSSTRGFPIARSVAGGSYHVTAAISSPGSSPGAPVPVTSYADYIRQNIAHELGHGIGEEVANHLNRSVFKDFNTKVGWVSGKLFDIGELAVSSAIAAGQLPPSQFEITPDHWNDPNWKEQPMSNYSVSGGPGEDFAESISAYIYSNNVLKSRSPNRYQFIQAGIPSWQSVLHVLTPLLPPPLLGDYPEPDKSTVPV